MIPLPDRQGAVSPGARHGGARFLALNDCEHAKRKITEETKWVFKEAVMSKKAKPGGEAYHIQ
jgi:hypothetical protein